MNKGELIYLASPYSIGNTEVNFRIVTEKAAELVSEGYTVISPITYGHTLLGFKEMPNDWKFWINFCSELLYKCDRMVIYKMPGWEISVGIAEEMSIARDHGIPIDYIDYIEPENKVIVSQPTRENNFYEEIKKDSSPKWDL